MEVAAGQSQSDDDGTALGLAQGVGHSLSGGFDRWGGRGLVIETPGRGSGRRGLEDESPVTQT